MDVWVFSFSKAFIVQPNIFGKRTRAKSARLSRRACPTDKNTRAAITTGTTTRHPKSSICRTHLCATSNLNTQAKNVFRSDY